MELKEEVLGGKVTLPTGSEGIHSMELKEILACPIANTHIIANLNLPSTSSNPGVCRGLP